MSGSIDIDVKNPIKDKEEFIRCYRKFISTCENNADTIERIERSFLLLDDKNSFPNSTFDLIAIILPKFLDPDSLKYLLHILSRGHVIMDEPEMDLTSYIILSKVVKKYRFTFLCSFPYLDNPHDYVGATHMVNPFNGLYRLKIIRADQQSLDLSMDLESSVNLSKHILTRVLRIIKQGEYEPDQGTIRSLLSVTQKIEEVLDKRKVGDG